MAEHKYVTATKALIIDALSKLGLQLFDLEFIREDGVDFLRVSIDDKDFPIDFDICEKASNALSPLLDEVDPIPVHYILEVCSPGIERPIRNVDEYKASVGQYISVYLNEPIDTKETITGTLNEVNEHGIIMTYKNKTRDKKTDILFTNIQKAHKAVKF